MKQYPEHWPTHRAKTRGKQRRHRAAVRRENRLRVVQQKPAAQRNWSRGDHRQRVGPPHDAMRDL